jgi:hypothetical protein
VAAIGASKHQHHQSVNADNQATTQDALQETIFLMTQPEGIVLDAARQCSGHSL